MDGEKKKPLPYVLFGGAIVAAVLMAMKWTETRVEDPVTRLRREKGEIVAAIMTMAKKDLPCETVTDIREPNGELWAYGCGKRARYVATKNGTLSLSGAVELDDACVVRWSREGDAGDPREVASKLHDERKPARIRIPITAFGVTGLAKLRYSEHIEVFVEDDAGALPDALIVPCIGDGGTSEGTCTKEWSSVVEVAECAR